MVSICLCESSENSLKTEYSLDDGEYSAHNISNIRGRSDVTCIACTVLGFFYDAEQTESYKALLFLIVPIGYLQLVRHTVKKFVWFFLLHMPLFLSAVSFGRDFGEKAVIGACTVVMTVISLHICMMEEGSVNECPSMKLCMILLGCYGISRYLGHPVCARYIYGEILLFVLLRIVHESLENTIDFIHINKGAENLPAGQMMVINRIMLLLFLAVMLAVMYIMPKLHLEIIAVPETFTPKELLAMAESRSVKQGIKPEEQEKICRIYEKARYGEEECTKEETEEIRKLLV